jgi:hypothetical protein
MYFISYSLEIKPPKAQIRNFPPSRPIIRIKNLDSLIINHYTNGL